MYFRGTGKFVIVFTELLVHLSIVESDWNFSQYFRAVLQMAARVSRHLSPLL
jgi:hypothetical protein